MGCATLKVLKLIRQEWSLLPMNFPSLEATLRWDPNKIDGSQIVAFDDFWELILKTGNQPTMI
jgi:hypothetical protein